MKKRLAILLLLLLVVGCGKSKGEKAAKAKAAAEAEAKVAAAEAEVAAAEAKAAADWKVIEKVIRKQLKKPVGELTEADLEKVTELSLANNQLTDVPTGLEKLTQLEMLVLGNNQLTNLKGLEKLTQLEELYILNNPDLTKAQIDELQKALPNCFIISE